MTLDSRRGASPNRNRYIVVAGVSLVAASAGLMDFLGTWEGRGQYTVYADRLAGGLPTVCRGITKHVTSTPIIVGERWSAEKCDAEESAAVLKVQQQLAKCFKLPPSQSVWEAATSHAWNFGHPSTCASLAMQAWNQGHWELGCRRISRGDDGRIVWAYVGKTFYQGLANRRKAETSLCLSDEMGVAQ